MPRSTLYAASFIGICCCFACSSDSGAGPNGTSGGSSSSGLGGQTTAGSTQGGSAGSTSIVSAGTASGGQALGGSSIGGTGSGVAGTTSGGTGVVGGSANGGSGSGGGPAKVTGTPLVYVSGFGNFPLRVYELDATTGKLTQRGGDEDGGQSPSYLAVDPSGTHIYNTNEDDGDTAGITAHHIKADGTLERLNHQQGSKSCGGSCGFTYVAVDPGGKFVFGADYDGGSLSVFPINADGSLGAEKQMLDFGGKAEAHSIAFDSSGQYAFVPTLGLDQVQQLKLGADGMLSANTPANVLSAKNAGPRHISMHPTGKWAFVMNETASTLTPYAVSADGKLTAGTTISSMPPGTTGEIYGQHVKISPDGHFLYASNVGHDSLAVFAVDQSSGALTSLQDQPSGGAWPRDFDIDPNGEVLIAANRDSNSLVVFKIGVDGKLTQLGEPTTVPNQPSSVLIRYQK